MSWILDALNLTCFWDLDGVGTAFEGFGWFWSLSAKTFSIWHMVSLQLLQEWQQGASRRLRVVTCVEPLGPDAKEAVFERKTNV